MADSRALKNVRAGVVGGYMVGPVKTTGAEASEFSSNVFHDLCLYNIVFACVFM